MRLAMKHILFLFIMIGASINGPAIGHAAGTTTKYTSDLPGAEVMTVAGFEKITTLKQVKPFADHSFSYSIRIPNQWEDTGNILRNDRDQGLTYGSIAEYTGPQSFGISPRIEVQIFELKNAIGAFHWLYDYLIGSGVSVEAIEYLDWDRAQALYVVFERGASFKVRSKVVLSGSKIVQISYLIPVSNWVGEKDLQAHLIDHFGIMDVPDEPVEPIRNFEIFNVINFSFFESWRFSAGKVTNVQDIQFNFTHESDRPKEPNDRFLHIDGNLNVRLLGLDLNPNLAEILDGITKKAEASGYDLGAVIESVSTFAPKNGVEVIGIESYQLLDRSGTRIDHELWVAILKSAEYYYILSLDTPSREGKYLEWAHNIAALKILVESIVPQ